MTRWQLPSLSLLERPADDVATADDHTAELERTLTEHGAAARVIGRDVAPQVVRYRVKPGAKVLPAKIERLTDALSLATGSRVRYAGIEGGAVVLEVPRAAREYVSLREAIDRAKALVALGFPIGVTTSGEAYVAHLAKLPHLLIAGTTGAGKSGMVNALLTSLLMRNTPDDMQLVLVDPKRVELAPYAGLPHMAGEVIDDMADAARALEDVVGVMDQRYETFKRAGARNLSEYNDKARDRLPRIVVVIDELADLLLTNKASEEQIVRIGAVGRAAGIHMVLATQRPAADTITKRISANVSPRAVFAVQSHTESNVALGESGAERLTGQGDGLWSEPGRPTVRFQAPWVSSEEVERVVQAWQVQTPEAAPPTVQATAAVKKAEDDIDRAAREELARNVAAAKQQLLADPQELLDEAGISDEVLEAVAEKVSGKIMEKLALLLESKEA